VFQSAAVTILLSIGLRPHVWACAVWLLAGAFPPNECPIVPLTQPPDHTFAVVAPTGAGRLSLHATTNARGIFLAVFQLAAVTILLDWT
jgi:hypothetical protein